MKKRKITVFEYLVVRWGVLVGLLVYSWILFKILWNLQTEDQKYFFIFGLICLIMCLILMVV